MKNKLLIESIYLISRTVIVRVTADTRVLSNSDKDYKKKKILQYQSL